MENICAIIDVQGFYVNSEFLVRELAIVSPNLCLCQEFNPNIKWNDLNLNDYNTVKHCYNRVHGLSLNSISYAEK